MPSLAAQKTRIEDFLKTTPAKWKDYRDTPTRYRLPKPNDNASSLWLAVAIRSETFTVVTTGELSADMGLIIKKRIGRPTVTNGNHFEWRRVSFEDTCQIIEEFNRLFSAL